jgi:RNA polymerase sigma-70 factor (ECF subfamily)
MKDEPPSKHLDDIETAWPLLQQALTGTPEARRRAQGQVLKRYRPAVYRYLLAGLRDTDAAEELWQEFALHFLRGDFRHADAHRDRFPGYLRTVLSHLTAQHHRRIRQRPRSLSAGTPEPAANDRGAADIDRVLPSDQRDELLARTWAALAECERRTGRPLFMVLLCHVRYPDEHSQQLAERLTMELGKHVSAEWVRKWLCPARDKFANLLVDEAARILPNPTPDRLALQLGELGLLTYCRSAWMRRR